MATPNVLKPGISGLPLSSTDYNNNWAAIEGSFLDLGPFIISGLVPSAGAGLSVNVTAGVALLGATISQPAFVIGGLAPSLLNYLYLQQNGAGTSNTTGVPPSNSALLGTATTGVATVTSVAVGQGSGRQQWVEPSSLIPGGPAAGLTSAGHLASINLAGWMSAAGEGVPVYGQLPPQAVGGGGHLVLSGGSTSAAAAGSNAGTSPPAPVVTAGANDTRGNITFGTGTGAAAGNMVVVTFASAYSAAPFVLVIAKNAATAALLPFVTTNLAASFTLAVQGAPASSQANTTFSFDYFVVG